MKTYYEIIFEPICCTLSPVKANCVLNPCKLIHGIENPCVALEGSFKLRPSLPFTQWKIRYNVIFTLCHVVFLIPDVSFNPLIFKQLPYFFQLYSSVWFTLSFLSFYYSLFKFFIHVFLLSAFKFTFNSNKMYFLIRKT